MPFKLNPFTGELDYYSSGGGAGTGDVVGPASSTDNAIAAFNGTTGKLLKNTQVNVLPDSSSWSGYPEIQGTGGALTIIGGTGSGNDLILKTTTHATPGDYFLEDLYTKFGFTGFVVVDSSSGILALIERIGTSNVDNDAITYAKMQNVSAASRLLGRGSAGGAGDVEEITLGSGLTMTGTTLSASGGSTVQSGQVEVDFGASETDVATVTVSAAWVTATSKIVCNPSATATADHSVDEVWAEGINAYPTNIVNGVSFDIVAKSCGDGQSTWGKYNINYLAV